MTIKVNHRRESSAYSTYMQNCGWMNQVGSDTTLHPDTLAAELQQSQSVDADGKQELLAAREAVWRAWFANDGPRLAELVPQN